MTEEEWGLRHDANRATERQSVKVKLAPKLLRAFLFPTSHIVPEEETRLSSDLIATDSPSNLWVWVTGVLEVSKLTVKIFLALMVKMNQVSNKEARRLGLRSIVDAINAAVM